MNQDTKKKFDNILNKARNLSKLGVRGLFLPRQITSSLFRENTSIDIANLNMNEVAIIVDECEICALHKNRNSTVFGEGNTNANLMFIGEAPGKDEDIAGKPFVGKAGQLLDKIILAMKLHRKDIYICNVVKCRPENNRKPSSKEINSCFSFLNFQINQINPKIIICLGAAAAEAVLDTEEKIKNLRGVFHDKFNSKIIVTYHPAALLRDPTKKKLVWEDMQMVMKEMESFEE